jgi:hypothetical protein
MSRELLQQALDALKYHTEHTYPFHLTNVAIEALQKALAQPEQEPVALNKNMTLGCPAYLHELAKPEQEQEPISTNDHLCAMLRQVHDVLACTALPMKRKWVGLTDEEIEEAWGNTPMMLNARDGGTRKVFARAIETKLKELNT